MRVNFAPGSIPLIMGILNVTPDSFSDGGKYQDVDLAVQHAFNMVADGADIIDIGAESTRPDAAPVTTKQELQRILPIVKELLNLRLPVPISIDSSNQVVIDTCLDLGVSIINDVRALSRVSNLEKIKDHQANVCIMHMQKQPVDMQKNPSYENVVEDIAQFLQNRVDYLVSCGVELEKIWIDPGFGFGKNIKHNLLILKNLDYYKKLGCKILVGLSRKSMFGKLLGIDTQDRLAISVVAATIAAQNGADILRVHDVAQTNQALKLLQALNNCEKMEIVEYAE